jgi:valyl-tRNA synthetase
MDMDKVYNHKNVEDKWYRFWEEKGYFTPPSPRSGQAQREKPFVITLPPPNVTGGLHAGHALYTVEDVLARYHRMKGEPTLFLPGFDHASIAVEYLVSKKLAREGKTKRELGREEFLRQAQEFANESRDYIRAQLKKLGFSLDWTREAYTMDKTRSRAVEEAFKRLYEKGLIYQGDYLVNWCPGCQTAISDLENIHREEDGRLYFVKYGPITVATTRPETIFADVAVAVHPDDKRYQDLIGQQVVVPLAGREVKVIADDEVDPEFGTGALKITPAHDPRDFEIGRRHDLPMDKVAIGFDGNLTKLTGPYAGLSVVEGRKKVVADLKKGGFLEKVEDHAHAVGHCERCGAVTEPLISKQWFVSTNSKFKIQSAKLRELLGVEKASLAEMAILAVKQGHIKIIPKRFEKTYFHWLENIKDWCISRQLWWGHKIPLEGVDDTLDTWFSSSLWTISTLGWPEETEDFEYFYPTTVRETGYDILFFWVAREIMMCLEMTGEVPFEVVYLHGLVRDERGRKFSKTKGIGFDPLEVIEKYGADALRMALLVGNAPGNDLKIGEEKIKAYRNFANKIWNASRFVLANEAKLKTQKSKFKIAVQNSKLTEEDRDILEKLDETVKSVTAAIDNYRLDLAAEELYHFFWHEFCDRCLEQTKPRLKGADPEDAAVAAEVLLRVLQTSLRLLHPFMPFITEEIFQKLPVLVRDSDSIMLAPWPR